MMRYRLKVRKYDPARVVVSLPVENTDQQAEIVYEGADTDVAKIREVLMGAYGLYGYAMHPVTTAADLVYAMASSYLQGFEPELLDGKDIIEALRRETA